MRALPLEERKKITRRLDRRRSPRHLIRNTSSADGKKLFALAQKRGLEGIMAKRRDSEYESGRRTRDWLKIKTQKRQEFVIGGWTEPRGSRSGFGALIVGYYEKGKLIYAGHVGTGFDAKMLAALAQAACCKLERKTSPFAIDAAEIGRARALGFSRSLSCEVRFTEWTDEGYLRHPAFMGLREDKDAKDVVREAEVRARRSRIASAKTALAVGKRTLAVTNLDKVILPKDGYHERRLIAYYRAVAKWILPYTKGRPLTLERYPNGIDKPGWWEKHIPKGLPDWVPTVNVQTEYGRHRAESSSCCATTKRRSHTSRTSPRSCCTSGPRANRRSIIRDFLLIDLDRGDGCTLATLAASRCSSRDAVDRDRPQSAGEDDRRQWAARRRPARAPLRLRGHQGFRGAARHGASTNRPRRRRRSKGPIAQTSAGTVYLDYVQVGRGKTLRRAVRVRARDGAPVSFPLAWTRSRSFASKRAKTTDQKNGTRWNLETVPALLRKDGDAWKGAWRGHRLERALQKARKLWG